MGQNRAWHIKFTRWRQQMDVIQLVFGWVHQNAAPGAKSAIYDYFVLLLVTWNAWQSLAYSPFCVVVSPHSEYLWNTPNYWLPQCVRGAPRSRHSWTNRGQVTDAGHTNSYVLNGISALLMRAFTKRYCILFRNARSKSEGDQFRRLHKSPQNYLVTIATSLGLPRNYGEFCEIRSSTAEIFGKICRFLPSRPKRYRNFRYNHWG